MRLTMIRRGDNNVLSQNYCDFMAPGGTIGRDTNSTLVLPDQTRAISRLQAVIHISSDGKVSITHRGSTTALIINGNALAHNVQYPLADGDILDVGDYSFSVNLTDLSISSPTLPLQPDLMLPAKSIDETIWDDLEEEFMQPMSEFNRTLLHESNHPLFDNDADACSENDVLSESKYMKGDFLYEKITDPDHLFLQDELFSLSSITKDTTPSVLSEPPPYQNKDNPLQESTLQSIGVPTSSLFDPEDGISADWALSADNDGGDDILFGLFADNIVPLSLTDPILALDAQPEDVTWMEQPREVKNIHFTASHARNDEIFCSEIEANIEENKGGTLAPPMRLSIDPVNHLPLQLVESSSQEQLHGELLHSFITGLGLHDTAMPPTFAPEQLHLAGKLLSLFSQGTVALLSSRNILKRGLKAEMTMILEEENNPFKMLPSGKTVLMQMFCTPMPGFIPPEHAVRDAMIDLQAHQLGMIAGVRAIIAAMLQTFNPDTLERMAMKEGSVTNKGLFSGNKKAALWEMLKSHYQKVINEVEDDFNTLFGEAFLHAYDLEIRQYKMSQTQKVQP